MKLVQLLAKELKEWPEGAKHARQDFDGEICFVGGGIWSDFYASCVASDIYLEDGIGTSKITEDQWQAEREKMNKPKWIRHRGGKCPVKAGTKVITRYRDGVVSDWCMTRNQDTDEECLSAIWSHSGGETDIMAYYVEESKDQDIKQVKVTDAKLEMMQGDSWVTIGRIAPDFRASVFDGGPLPKDEEVKDTNLGTLTYKMEVDTSSAMNALNELSAKWDQLESPLKWRDAIIHCQAIIEDCEREIGRNVNLLDAEGLMMQKDSKKAMQHYQTDIDMSDCRNWKTGDVIEIVANEAGHKFENGEEVIVAFLDLNDTVLTVNAEYKDGSDYWWLSGKDAKFIRRP